MSVGVIRIFLDRLEHLLLRRFLPAFLAGGDAEVIVRCRALWIDCERLGQLGERVVKFALLIIDDPERGMGEFVLRRDGDRFLERQLGGFQLAVAEEDNTRDSRASRDC